jgi:hypothetical protein
VLETVASAGARPGRQSSTSIGRRNGRRGQCPLTNRPSFLIAQLCIAVNQKIRLQRHVVAFDALADLAQFFQPPRRVVVSPVRKRCPSSPFVDVIHNPPGNRRNVGVPRPPRTVRVAVTAGAIEHCGYVGRRMFRRHQHLLRIDWRVGPRWPDQLADRENRQQSSAGSLRNACRAQCSCKYIGATRGGFVAAETVSFTRCVTSSARFQARRP